MKVEGFSLGASHIRQVIILEPPFEEANRTRRTLACVMRALDNAGIGSVIPDIPGTAESLVDVETIRLADWRQAVAEIAKSLSDSGKIIVVASLRGGALIDDAAISATGWWRCAPETGQRLVRDLRRAQKASGDDPSSTKLAGNAFSDAFLADLEEATPSPVSPLHVARLETDAADADSRLTGSPVWRRAEPGEDTVLTEAISENLIAWVKQCVSA
jgi:hypothetical protein